MGEVSFTEANLNLVMGAKAARELVQKGFVLADTLGIAVDGRIPKQIASLGLLRGQEFEVKRFLGGLISRNVRRRRDHVGNIYFSNACRGVKNKNWSIDIYGRENVEEFKQIAEFFSKTYAVNIDVQILSESPQQKRYGSDFDFTI